MPGPNQEVRVFVSSTFRDMHAERDHLVTVVFPELRERIERLGLDFFDVDLRWGVPETGADGEKANSWEYCRQWIDRVEPFFICILGQRYGWVPEPDKLKDEADRERQTRDPRSITDMEIRHAVLDRERKPRSYFYLRGAEAPSTTTDFVEGEQLLAEKLDRLKQEVRDSGRPARDYPCEWKDDDEAFTGMDSFGRMVLDDLWSGVLRDERYVSKEVWREALGGADPDADPRYTDEAKPVPEDLAAKIVALAKPPPQDPLDAEREQMRAFAASRLRWFQGRVHELDELRSFILDPAEENAPRLAIVAAVPGQGKSALMAKLSGDSAFADPQSTFAISHFVGATERSSSAYNLVKRLLDELDRSGIEWPVQQRPEGEPATDLQLDFNSLCLRLSERLGDYAGERRIVILLDALNQLDDGHDLGWLPYRLGPGVRIVVSCIDDSPLEEAPRRTDSGATNEDSSEQKVLAALNARRPEPKRVLLGELGSDDVRAIVEGYLHEYCKELDQPHIDAICDNTKLPQARNPLYLLVMLAELRTLGGNDMREIVPALIAGMAEKYPDTVSLFKWVLQRMEAADGFGEEAVKWWCLYLALGRAGMASRELADLLARKLRPEAATTAQRIERGLRRFLQRRGETLDVFHGQLRKAIMEKYGDQADVLTGHGEIANYFRSLADPDRNESWKGESQRPFNEIAFHLIGAQQWDDLCAYLTDFRCLDVRIRAGQIFEVVNDHQAADSTLPELAEETRREQERVEICTRYGVGLIKYAHDCAEGNKSSLPEPPGAQKTAAAYGATGEVSQRAGRLKTIANFIRQRATLLEAYPMDFLAVAANGVDAGSLADAAALLANAGGFPCLHRHPRPPSPLLTPVYLSTLRGHTGGVTGVALTSDGSRAVSASNDYSVRVWDIASGQCITTLKEHQGQVASVALTPDGSRAVSGGYDDTVRVWDIVSGQCVATLRGHSDTVFGVALTPDSSRAVSASHDNTLRVWDLVTGRCINTLQWPMEEVTIVALTHFITSVALTPEGSRAISGGYDDTVRVWDIPSGQCIATLKGHSDTVSGVAVTPDGSRVVSASCDRTLRVWNLAAGECIATLQGHTDTVHSVAITSDGSRAVSASGDSSACVWNLAGGQPTANVPRHTKGVTSVTSTPDGSRAVSASHDKTLRIWDFASGRCLVTLRGHTKGVTHIALTPDGFRAVSASRDKTLRAWDLAGGECFATFRGHTDTINSVALTPDGSRAVSASHDKTLRVWDFASGRCLVTLQGHTKGVTQAAVTPDGSRAVSSSTDDTLRIWDLASGRCLATLPNPGVTNVVVTPDGSGAIAASYSNLSVWNLDNAQRVATIRTSTVDILTLTPDGSRAVCAKSDKSVLVWDLENRECVATLRGHTSWITGVSCTSDGSRAVSISFDETMRVWDLATAQCLAVYHAGASAHAVSVLSSDDHIVCGTADGEMHFLTMKNFPEAASA